MHSRIFESENTPNAHSFYQLHPEYIPFIGEKFDEFKILQVGESHYVDIGKTPETEKEFSIQYFADNWWSDHCSKLYMHPDENPDTKCWGSWYTTRHVIDRFFKNNQKNYSIFSNPLKIFRDVCLNNPVEYCADDNFRQAYHYFAFMNFFQMPALYKGESFWKSLCSADKHPKLKLAYSLFERTAEISAGVLDDVIKALKPTAVVFTSSSAWTAYKKYGTYANSKNDPVMIHTAHPGCCWWNRKKKDGTSSCQHLETELKRIFQK